MRLTVSSITNHYANLDYTDVALWNPPNTDYLSTEPWDMKVGFGASILARRTQVTNCAKVLCRRHL